MNTIAFVDTPEQKAALNAELQKLRNVKGPLMIALQKTQDIYGYLPESVLTTVAEFFDVPLQDLYGVITFYSQFHLKPRGKYKVGVCMGTACYVRDASKLLDKLKDMLKINPGETTPDILYSLEATRCVGCCGLAPLITVNENVYGKIGPDNIPAIMEKYKG